VDPKDKVALITGGARIGAAIAEALARRGCHVALTYRSSRRAVQGTVLKLRSLGVRALAVKADLSRSPGAAAAVEATHAAFGGPDIMVCMASVYEETRFDRLDHAAWRRNIEVDLTSAYHLALEAAPLMKARGGGRIVNFTDWLPASGRPRYRHLLPYYVAKSGVIGLTESLALELAPTILVNAIAPGPILRPPGFTAARDRAVRRATPLGRWGGPEEIARAVLFLIETEFVTGETLRVDGGRHLR